MTKEELEKEATEYAQKLGAKDFIAKPKEIVAYFGYLASAEPREKQIEIDAKQIRALQKQNGELTDRVKELEAQIEKMKRCSICKYSTDLGYCKIRCNGGECNKMDKWEIKEK